MTDKALIIDGSSILFRAYYALPEMNTSTGKATNGVLGFFNILFKALDLIDPKYIAIAFDLSGPTFRNQLYKDYKGHRKPTPDDLKEQFDYVRDILDALEFTYFQLEDYEADDIAGSLASQASAKDYGVYLLTGDKDYLQLVDKNTKLLYTRRGVTELDVYDEEAIREEYGLEPRQIIDMLGLMGDPSDNIPGIDGVGEKTAIKLLKEFGSIDGLYENKDKLKDNKTNQRIIASEDLAKLSRNLATIVCNLDLGINESSLEIKEVNKNKVRETLEKYELRSLISRLKLDQVDDNSNDESSFDLVFNEDPEKIISQIKEEGSFAFKIFYDKLPYDNGQAKMIGFLVDENIYIRDLKPGLQSYREVFEDEDIAILSYGLKEDIIFLIDENIRIKNYQADISIGEYLLNPTAGDYDLDRMASIYGINLGLGKDDLKIISKKQYDLLSSDSVDLYLEDVLTLIARAQPSQDKRLKELDMDRLYKEIELPLVEVLASMQYRGVCVDEDALIAIGKDLDQEIDQIIDRIHSLAGRDFNVNSPKQLGQVLFEELKLPAIKKTKTGYSTSIEVLEDLEGQHEIISYIIRYRTISKLKNTYVDGILPYINENTARIHSHFNQTVTATGRLSSTNPNLQNIPIRTEDGRVLRKIFIAPSEDYILLDADYSQIELRILAHISQDKNMIRAFEEGNDIHTTTAAKVFNLEPEEVTGLMRSRAKAVNFGIVYGISDYGLSRDLKIPRAEAKEYIDNYLARFDGVATYMENIVKLAKEQGYVSTDHGRIRYLPELKSKNWNTVKFGERIALNMPIQGSAADIIKIAMIRVYNRLEKEGLESKLILQIHDELIVETKIDEEDQVKKILREEMESAVDLRVPLIANITRGESWYDT